MKVNEQEQCARFLINPSIKILDGLYFDCALGLRVMATIKSYRIKMIDDFSNYVYLDQIVECGKTLYSPIRFYVKWRLEVYENDKKLYEYVLDLKDKQVHIQATRKTIGDFLAWLPAIDKFQKKHQCKLTVLAQYDYLIDIVYKQYPNITFVSDAIKLWQTPCLAYYLLCIGNLGDANNSPFDYRFVGLRQVAYLYLHVDWDDNDKSKLDVSHQRIIPSKYVVLSRTASGKIKQLQDDNKWIKTVQYLLSLGYKVIQIGLHQELIEGCYDKTGQLSLQEIVDLIKDADFYLGVSSGFSWIAYCCNIPVVLIGTITFPFNQFYTKYRVHSLTGCRGCWQNPFQYKFNEECLYDKQHQQYMECNKYITTDLIINTINKLIRQQNL